jgi:hypothetical protein
LERKSQLGEDEPFWRGRVILERKSQLGEEESIWRRGDLLEKETFWKGSDGKS